MDKVKTLNLFNLGLSDLREMFYKTGRLEDSNTKLDEVVKLLSLEVASVYETSGSVPNLKYLLDKTPPKKLVSAINDALCKAANTTLFMNPDGESLLGSNPRMNLSDNEYELAAKIANLVCSVFNDHLRNTEKPNNFDLLNESFGYFIRDNFRNNIEDAQYMTPIEVVSYMCEIGLEEAIRITNKLVKQPFVVADPSCGVGSFLTQFYRFWIKNPNTNNKHIILLGQDKVDRMARLAKLNLLLFRTPKAIITRGNSLLPGSELDKYIGKCDLILTNPPFGARFHSSELSTKTINFFPCFDNIIRSTNCFIDSELLFIDRYISLLKPGGAALAILPDSVISSKGIQEIIREYLTEKCTLVSLTELPTVTFAQAGTRTKTCVLHFRKEIPKSNNKVFIANVLNVGFDVASRKGVPYKKCSRDNDLIEVYKAYKAKEDFSENDDISIIFEEPSCVSIYQSKLTAEPWTPSHHSAKRYLVLSQLIYSKSTKGNDYELKKLKDLVYLPNQTYKGIMPFVNAKCVSVLHIGDFGSLNIQELMSYRPKYQGQPCKPGDVLFSKINPRIPRVIVIPDLNVPLNCSNEFEVIRPKPPYTPYEVMMLLLSAIAQTQIRALTSGTSSSHNRIKTAQLMDITLAIPTNSSHKRKDYLLLIQRFKKSHEMVIKASYDIYKTWCDLQCLLSV
jgi:type I restriction-modification system DNA methylase subunit